METVFFYLLGDPHLRKTVSMLSLGEEPPAPPPPLESGAASVITHAQVNSGVFRVMTAGITRCPAIVLYDICNPAHCTNTLPYLSLRVRRGGGKS